MKKAFALLLFLACSLTAFSQDKKMSVGIAPEWNMNSRHYFAGGIAMGFDHKLPINAAFGFNVTGSTNFSGFNAIEPAVMFRGYLPDKNYSGFFFQCDLGVFLLFEDGDITPYPKVGYRSGYRLPLGKTFYIEPYGRLGYPFAFGIGVMTGLCF